jgi:hypothetical protein
MSNVESSTDLERLRAPSPLPNPAALPKAIAAAVTLMVTLIRIWFGRHITFCGTPDSCAYLSLAESLSHHHGFVQRFLYQYQFVSTHLPSHGIEYWRPGEALILLLAQPFGGVTLFSSIFVTNLMAIFLALAAWKIAARTTANQRIACTAYLLCLVLPAIWSNSVAPDSSLFYGVFGAWFLTLFSVEFRSLLSDTLALLCVAAVNLIRNDAILLLLPLLVVLWMRRRSGATRGASTAYMALMGAGFFAAMLPMALLRYAVLGTFSGDQTSRVLYLTSLSEISRYGPALNLHTMLASGIGNLVKLRIETLPTIFYRVFFFQIGFSILFLPALALSRHNSAERRQIPELSGAFSFGLGVLGVYGLLLPAIGGFSALKSFTAILPLLAALIAAGIYKATKSESTAMALAAMTILLYVTLGITQDRVEQVRLNHTGEDDRRIASYLAAHGADITRSLIMTKGAAQFSETTGYAAIPVPTNGLVATQAAAHDLGAGYILLDDSEIAPSAESVQAALHAIQSDHIPGTSTYVFTRLATQP